MYHRPDMMRLELLLRHGGIFLDHDAYVVDGERLQAVRACPAAPVIAGFEQAGERREERKLNPGATAAQTRGS